MKLGFRSIVNINCGFAVELPEGYKLCIAIRSKFAKKGLFILNSPAQIDTDYRGSIEVVIGNFSHEYITINDGERFAQCWIEPVCKFDWTTTDQLSETDRGEGGFGSTGDK